MRRLAFLTRVRTHIPRRFSLAALLALIAVCAMAMNNYAQEEVVKAYAVADLIAKPAVAGNLKPAQFQPLIAEIERTVEPRTWKSAGGPGTITPFFLNSSLIVRNNRAAHDALERHLRSLRDQMAAAANTQRWAN
jgi:hypothetical protein